MKLVLVTHGGRTAFEVRYVTVVIGHDERALKLSRTRRIDTEIGTQFHGAACTLGNIYKRAVTEYGRVECSKIVVTIAHDRAEVLFHQIGIFSYRLTDGAEDDTLLKQRLLESGLHRHRVHHGIYRHASAQCQTLFERYAQLVKGLHHLRVYLVEALGALFLLCRVGIVRYGLIVNLGNVEMCPPGHLQSQPVVIGLQTKVKQPLGLALLCRDEAHHLFTEPHGNHLGIHIGSEAIFVLLLGEPTYVMVVCLLVGFIILILFHTFHLSTTKVLFFIETCKPAICF